MLAQLAIVSFFSTAAFAQSSTASAAGSIPTGISSGCTSFLESLNKNSAISACTSSVVSATENIANSSSGASATEITSSLNTLCSSDSTCPASTIRSTLTDFYSSCSDELTSSKNGEVIAIYDMLYALVPMKTAVCSKNDDGSYCVLHASSTSLAASAENVQKYLSTDSGSANMTTFSSNSIPFLGISESLSSDDLCVSCTRKILTSYIQFMSDASYAPGISSSVLLSKESTLYNTVTSTCGSAFLSGVVNAAGGIGTGSDEYDAALSMMQMDFRLVIGAVLGMAGVLAFH